MACYDYYGNFIAVNRTADSVEVYDLSGRTMIGIIEPREGYAVNVLARSDGVLWVVIWRDGATGTKRTGAINGDNSRTGAMTPISLYPHGGLDLVNPVTGQWEPYKTFLARSTMNIYNCDGSYWGQVKAGQFVAAHDSWCGFSGDNHPDWLRIGYVRREWDKKWIEISKRTGDPCDYGFVPIGLEYGSMPSTIPIYGSW